MQSSHAHIYIYIFTYLLAYIRYKTSLSLARYQMEKTMTMIVGWRILLMDNKRNGNWNSMPVDGYIPCKYREIMSESQSTTSQTCVSADRSIFQSEAEGREYLLLLQSVSNAVHVTLTHY